MTRARIVRLSILAVLIVGALIAGKLTGVGARFTTAGIRELTARCGTWGALVFVAVVVVGQLVWIPATVFFAAAVLAYGRTQGAVVSYAAAMASVTVSFVFVRTVGGQPLAELRNKWMQKILARLDQRPFWTVFALRFVFWSAPPVNYALALSKLRYRDYLAGSAVGLVLPVIVASLFFGILFN